MVKIENIAKSFNGKKVLNDISLEVKEGEIFTILGESGCGKTTLLRLLAGFERPDCGGISIAGKNILPLPVEKRPVGFIFQSYALFPHLSVYDNIAIGPRVRRLPEDKVEKEINALLATARIKELKHAFPGQLSGGESQRVAIARAIVNRPKILLLDEPFAALDQSLRQSLRDQVVDIQKIFGITFFFVTHDQEEALSLSHRIGILEKGRLLQVGKPKELYDRPGTCYVARFLGDVNKLSGMAKKEVDGRVSIEMAGGQSFYCGPQNSPSFVTDDARYPATAYIRPENIILFTNSQSEETMNELQGVITKSVFYGGYTQYEVQFKHNNILKVRVQHGTKSPDGFRNGSKVYISFHPRNIFLFDEAQK